MEEATGIGECEGEGEGGGGGYGGAEEIRKAIERECVKRRARAGREGGKEKRRGRGSGRGRGKPPSSYIAHLPSTGSRPKQARRSELRRLSEGVLGGVGMFGRAEKIREGEGEKDRRRGRERAREG